MFNTLTPRIKLLPALLVILLTACAARPETFHMAEQCDDNIDHAYRELNFAASRGFSGKVSWAKAASLLTAAKTQQQFEKYPNCIEKVQRARYYIALSQR